MQKKYIIIGATLLVLFIAIIGVVYFFKEYKKVTFAIDYPGATATLTESNRPDKVIATVNDNSSVWLRKQMYDVLFLDDKLDNSPVSITVDDAVSTITLSPSLSDDTLSTMLESEQQAINAKVQSITTATSNYDFDEGTLYHRGEWYSTTIRSYQSSSDDPEIGNPDNVDTYYIVLKKVDNEWAVVAGPSLIITKLDNPLVPFYIINAINPVKP